MTAEFRRGLDGLVSSHRDEVQVLLGETELAALGAVLPADSEEERYVGVPVPAHILSGSVATVAGLGRALASVSPRWRLDVVLALDDDLS